MDVHCSLSCCTVVTGRYSSLPVRGNWWQDCLVLYLQNVIFSLLFITLFLITFELTFFSSEYGSIHKYTNVWLHGNVCLFGMWYLFKSILSEPLLLSIVLFLSLFTNDVQLITKCRFYFMSEGSASQMDVYKYSMICN